MQLGLMNNPSRDPLKEIVRIADMGFDFVDLTLEPPQARADRVDAAKIQAALAQRGLGVVGHTAYYLPLGSAFDAVHAGAIAEAEQCLHVFAEIGATQMNLHLDCRVPGHDISFINRRNVEAIERLLPTARRLHLDIGHANIRAVKSNTVSLLARYADRLRHVHVSDNKGRGDDHLAIGAGTIDWKRELKTLKATGYDGTITLETFYGDSDLILYSRDKVKRLWKNL